MNEWMYGCMDDWMDGCMDGCMIAWMDVWMYGWMMNGFMDGWTDEWMNGWMDERLVGWACGSTRRLRSLEREWVSARVGICECTQTY